MAFRPYLAFKGNCREAFTRYREIFSGELVLLTYSDVKSDALPPDGTPPDSILHAALRSGDDLLLGADSPPGTFDGNVHGMCANYATTEVEVAKQVFGALSEGGQVQMPLGETFFSPAFGMCIDRFGTPWMISTAQDSTA